MLFLGLSSEILSIGGAWTGHRITADADHSPGTSQSIKGVSQYGVGAL